MVELTDLLGEAADATDGPPDSWGSGNLQERVYARLKRALVVGELQPGQNIRIRELAQIVGTSPMPVRDALRRLAAERALEFGANRTVTVPVMTRSRFQEILQVRLALEAMAIRRAFPHMLPADIERFETIAEAMRAAGAANDISRYVELNRDFHFSIYEVGDSAVILPFIESLWMRVGPFLRLFFAQAGIQPSCDNHGAVLKALRRADPVTAGDEIQRDIADAADLMLMRGGFVAG